MRRESVESTEALERSINTVFDVFKDKNETRDIMMIVRGEQMQVHYDKVTDVFGNNPNILSLRMQRAASEESKKSFHQVDYYVFISKVKYAQKVDFSINTKAELEANIEEMTKELEASDEKIMVMVLKEGEVEVRQHDIISTKTDMVISPQPIDMQFFEMEKGKAITINGIEIIDLFSPLTKEERGIFSLVLDKFETSFDEDKNLYKAKSDYIIKRAGCTDPDEDTDVPTSFKSSRKNFGL